MIGLASARRSSSRWPTRKVSPLSSPISMPRSLVEAEIFVAEIAHEQQAVAAQPLDRGEEAEALHPGDPALDDLADAVAEEGRDIAVDGFALGLHRAPLELRNLLADLVEARLLAIGQPALAKAVGAGQRRGGRAGRRSAGWAR